MNPTYEILRGARDRIAHGWTQRASARDADCEGVEPFATEAVTWCLSGAINREWAARYASTDRHEAWLTWTFRVVKNQIKGLSKHGSVILWNDSEARTKEDVLDVLDRAIAFEGGNDNVPC